MNEENREYEDNQTVLKSMKEDQKRVRGELKQFWRGQLEENDAKKMKEKDADDVYKKQIEV